MQVHYVDSYHQYHICPRTFYRKNKRPSFPIESNIRNFAPPNSEEKTTEHDNTTNFPRGIQSIKFKMWLELSSNFSSDTLVTLYDPRLERIRYMKSRQSFSRLTRHAGVFGSDASHARIKLATLRAFRKNQKTTVLQSRGLIL